MTTGLSCGETASEIWAIGYIFRLKPKRDHRSVLPSGESTLSMDGVYLAFSVEASRQRQLTVKGANEENEIEPEVGSSRDFEQRLNSHGLGTVYRDILYCFAERGTRAELSGEAVRIVTNSEPNRVLATIQLTSRRSIVVGLLVGALTQRGDDVTESHELKAGEEGDALVARIRTLMSSD